MPNLPGLANSKVVRGLQGGREQPSKSEGVTGKVKSKPARVRPPRGVRDGLLGIVKHLPGYTGPYHIGTMEIELPAREPQTFSHITRHGRHILQLKTVLLTIYYPTSHPPPASTEANESTEIRYAHHPSRQLWLGRPRLGMMHGYSKFASMGWVGMPMFLPICWTKLPAWRNAPLSNQVPARGVKVETGKRRQARRKSERLADPSNPNEPPTYPVIMFSHGLGGTRTMYSSLCGEIASYGFIVCAVEHRDGSGPRTYINRQQKLSPSELEEERIGYKINHGPLKIRDGYDIVDYIFPQDNAYDTSPDNEKGVDRELRDHQIELRMAEFEEAYAALCEINAGNGLVVAERNIRKKGYLGSSSHGLEGIDWATWQSRMHLNSATALGHSFGAATTVEMLRHRDRFTWLSQGIILDIWSAGTRPTRSETDKHHLSVPILGINTEAFTYWPSNFEFVEKLTSEANPAPTWLATIRGTIHMSPSDFCLLYPRLCSFLLKSTANPKRALDLHIDMCLAFLHTILPEAHTAPFSHAYPKDSYLQDTPVQRLEQIPSRLKKRPEEKYMASRLKIQSEWKWRMAPTDRIGKRWIEGKREEGEEEEPEVWVHGRPDEGEVERWLKENHGAGEKGGKDGGREMEDSDSTLDKEGVSHEEGRSEESMIQKSSSAKSSTTRVGKGTVPEIGETAAEREAIGGTDRHNMSG